MRLLVFCCYRIYYNGVLYSSDNPNIQRLINYADFFDKIYICAPVKNTRQKAGAFQITHTKIEIIAFAHFHNAFDLYLAKLPFIFIQTLNLFLTNIKKFDAVLIIDPEPPCMCCYAMCKAFKKPAILDITGDDLYEIKFRNRKGLRKYLCRLYIPLFAKLLEVMIKHGVTTVSGYSLYDRYRFISSNIYIFMGHLISTADIEGDLPAIVNNYSAKKIRLLWVGRIVEYKGLDYLIDALKSIIDGNSFDPELVIVGEGYYQDELKRKISKLNLEKYVTFYGFIPFGKELLDLYRGADIFVLPSLTEGAPKAFGEAMSKGLPIIASSVGGITKMIEDGKNGLLVPPADAHALAKAIERLAGDKNLRSQIIKNNLKKAKLYTVEYQVQNLLKIYQAHYNIS